MKNLKFLVKRVEDYKPFKAVDGSDVVEVIGMKTTKTKEVSIAYATVKPKQKTILHKHDFTEVYIILKGKGIIYLNNESRPISKYDNILIPAKTWHQVENTGKTDLKIICICVPAFSERKTNLKNF